MDRGSFSVEVIFTLFAFKLVYPNHFYLARGNHESVNMNQMYGFEGEVKSKYPFILKIERFFLYLFMILLNS